MKCTCGASLDFEFARSFGFALRIDAQRRLLHRVPAGVVQDDREDRQLVLLRHGEHRARIAEIEAAVAGNLHHQAIGRRKLGAERHAAGPAEAAAAGAHRGIGPLARDLQQHRARIGDTFVEDDGVVVEHLAELRRQIVRVDRAGLALVGGELGGAVDAARRAAF